MKNIIAFWFLCVYGLWSVVCGLSYADTIEMKDGKEMKGIVVEDYQDRVVMSTAGGEVVLKKADIKELYFDNEAENLVKLAEQAKDRRDYARAFTYYNMALKVNPGYKPANDGLVFLQGYLFRKEESEKLDDIKRRENIERYGTVVPVEKTYTDDEKFRDLTKRLRSVLGLTLGVEKGFPVVIDVRIKSPAHIAGIRKDDVIVALWGKLTGYMSLMEIMETLLDKPSLEIKCAIERTVEVSPDGASFSMEVKGLTVSSVSETNGGLKKEDLVVSINGQSTRYMPFKKALELIKKSKNEVRLTIQREALIWRGE